jgi:hypothetical protein
MMIYDTLILKGPESVADLFKPELQKGFYIISYQGQTLYDFLTEDCGIDSGYITAKIKTVFINGGPLDDIYKTKIKEGAVCALSGAMPGIVGAMMRIGSPYAPMRESITVKPDDSAKSAKEILFELKLFNVILSDIGSDFLQKGIIFSKHRILELLNKHKKIIIENKCQVSLNNVSSELQAIDYYEKNLNETVKFILVPDNESKS